MLHKDHTVYTQPSGAAGSQRAPSHGPGTGQYPELWGGLKTVLQNMQKARVVWPGAFSEHHDCPFSPTPDRHP